MKIITALLICNILLSGCINEDLTECDKEPSTGVVLSYRYDLNMSYKNLFGQKVDLLSAYIFNESGTLQQKIISPQKPGQNWKQQVALEPGKYTILTWAGGENADKMFGKAHANETSDIPFEEGTTVGETKLDELRVFLRQNPLPDNKDKATPNVLNFCDLFHGIAQQVEVKPSKITEVVTRLTNNTKTIKLKISGLSLLNASAMESSDFDVKLSSRNEHYRYDNTVGEYAKEMIYTPFNASIDEMIYTSQIKTLRLIPQNDLWNTPVMLNVVFKPADNFPLCQDLDLVQTILSGKIDERDAEGNLILEDGVPVKVFPTREYLDRQDTFEVELVISESPDKKLFVTVKIENWKVSDIYPIPAI